MSLTQNLEYDRYYHIYNRGINGSNIFYSESDYIYFLKLMTKYLLQVIDIYAWALMSNHFHFLVRIKSEDEIDYIKSNKYQVKKKYVPANQISHLLSTYVIKFNKINNRHGSLFEKPFKRKLITSREYFKNIVYYIHNNPVKHKISTTIEEYKYTSFKTILSEKPTNLLRSEVINWFGQKQEYIEYHRKTTNLEYMSELLIDYET